jgi:hypothetical protein
MIPISSLKNQGAFVNICTFSSEEIIICLLAYTYIFFINSSIKKNPYLLAVSQILMMVSNRLPSVSLFDEGNATTLC